MNLRQIRYFVAVYEEGSFSKAAQREHCTQPGLSAQIKDLEEGLGNRLFDRSVHGVTPTLAGQQFYRHAVSILKSVQTAAYDMQEMSKAISGTIRVGLIPSAVRGLLPSVLPKFTTKYPEIQVSIAESYTATLTEWVLSGDLDFAVVIDPPNHEGLDIMTLSKENMVLISGTQLDFKPWEPIALRDTQPLKLVVPSKQHSLRQNIDKFIRTGDIKVDRLIEMDAMQGSIEFIRATDWAAILPYTSVVSEEPTDSLIFNPIVEPQIGSDFFLVHQTQRPLSKASQIFVDSLEDAVNVIKRSWDAHAPLKASA